MPAAHAPHLHFPYFAGGGERSTAKILKGALGFVTGFTIVFVAVGTLAGTVGGFLREHQTAVNICRLVRKRGSRLRRGGAPRSVLIGRPLYAGVTV